MCRPCGWMDPGGSADRVSPGPHTLQGGEPLHGPSKRHAVQLTHPCILYSYYSHLSLAPLRLCSYRSYNRLNSNSRDQRTAQLKMATAASVYPPLNQRPVKNTVLLFDVDDTLTKPRQVGHTHILNTLERWRSLLSALQASQQLTQASEQPRLPHAQTRYAMIALLTLYPACQTRNAPTAL